MTEGHHRERSDQEGEPETDDDLKAASDEVLVAMIQGRNLAAFDELLRRYNRLIEGIATSRCANREDARDAAQNAKLAIWRGIMSGSWKPTGKLGGWIARVASNVTISSIRAQRPDNIHGELDEDIGDGRATPPDLVAEKKEMAAQLRDAIAQLSATDQELFRLRIECDLSWEEIGELTGLSSDNAKQRFHRVLARLRRILEGRAPRYRHRSHQKEERP